jgi:hypothetical protein
MLKLFDLTMGWATFPKVLNPSKISIGAQAFVLWPLSAFGAGGAL